VPATAYRSPMIAALFPTFLVVGAGWLLGRSGRVASRPLAQVAFWVLSPALIFESLRTAELPAAGVVVLFAVLHMVGMFVLSWGVGRRFFPGDRDVQAAVSLVLTFGNCGNLGLPILLFVYGPPGVDVGVVFLAANTVLLATLGSAVACWEGAFRWRSALTELVRMPWLYAVGGALLVRGMGFPDVLSRATGLLANGAIPLFLLLLGVELAQIRVGRVVKPALGLSLVRLVGGAGLGWVLAAVLPVTGAVRGSLVVEGSVPTAVNAYLLAAQYDRRPDLAAAVLLLSTLLSLGTLSLTLFLLRIVG